MREQVLGQVASSGDGVLPVSELLVDCLPTGTGMVIQFVFMTRTSTASVLCVDTSTHPEQQT